MTFTPNREELAWAAGFWDGEGSTYIYHGNGVNSPPTVQISVAQTRESGKAILERFQWAVGGLGKIGGPYKSRNPKHAIKYEWCCTAFEEVQATIALLWTFLSDVKQSQYIEKVMTYLHSPRQRAHHRTHYRQKRLLKEARLA